MAKLKVTIDGKEHEVEAPPGWFSQADVEEKFVSKDAHEAELKRVAARARGEAKKPEQYLEDEEFKAQALKTWGLTGKKGENDAEITKRIRDELIAAEVKPRDEKLTAAEARIERLLDSRLQDEIFREAVAAGVKPAAAKMLIRMFDGQIGYDDESDKFYAYDEKNDRFVPSAVEGETYKGVKAVIADWAKNSENADFLVDQRQRGAGFKGAGAGGEGTRTIDAGSGPIDLGKAGVSLEDVASGKVQVRSAA